MEWNRWLWSVSGRKEERKAKRLPRCLASLWILLCATGYLVQHQNNCCFSTTDQIPGVVCVLTVRHLFESSLHFFSLFYRWRHRGSLGHISHLAKITQPITGGLRRPAPSRVRPRLTAFLRVWIVLLPWDTGRPFLKQLYRHFSTH